MYEMEPADYDAIDEARADAAAERRAERQAMADDIDFRCAAPRCYQSVPDAAMLCDDCLDLYYAQR